MQSELIRKIKSKSKMYWHVWLLSPKIFFVFKNKKKILFDTNNIMKKKAVPLL